MKSPSKMTNSELQVALEQAKNDIEILGRDKQNVINALKRDLDKVRDILPKNVHLDALLEKKDEQVETRDKTISDLQFKYDGKCHNNSLLLSENIRLKKELKTYSNIYADFDSENPVIMADGVEYRPEQEQAEYSDNALEILQDRVNALESVIANLMIKRGE